MKRVAFSTRGAVAAVGLIGLCGAPPVVADFETPVVLTGATVVVEPGRVIEGGAVLIDGARIVAVGADIDIPLQAERIDATGLIVYAGFIDAHSFLGVPDATRSDSDRIRTEDIQPDYGAHAQPKTEAAGRVGIRPQQRALDVFAPSDDDLKKYRSVGFTSALIAPRPGIFGGSSDLIDLSGDPIRRATVRREVAMHSSFSTGEGGGYPRSLLGIFAQFRQVLLDARWYGKVEKYDARHPGTERRAPRDEALEALRPVLARRQPLVFDASSKRGIHRALDLADEFKLDVVLSGVREAYKVIDRLSGASVPLIVSIKFDEEPEYGKKDKGKDKGKKKKESSPDDTSPDDTPPDNTPPEPRGSARATPPSGGDDADKDEDADDPFKNLKKEPLKIQRERRRKWDERTANIIRLHEAGIPFSLSTRDLKGPDELLKNLRTLIERGLPADAALAALTTTPARLLGVSNEMGAIKPGALANLVVMNKPFTDEKTKVRFVFIDGKKFELQEEKKGDAAKKADDEDSKESKAEESRVADEDSDLPTWEAEIEADRVPKTHTGGSVFIRGGTLLPVTGPAIEGGSILIEDGRITAIGQDLEQPFGVTVIDATGRFILPGFVDAHSHLGTDGVNEGTRSITAEVRIRDSLNPDSVGLYRALAGGVTTHHVMHGSANPIGGQNAIVKLKYRRPVSEMLIPGAFRTIKFALGENVTRANSRRFGGDARFPGTRMGVEAVIRGAMEAGVRYGRKWDEYDRRSRLGEDLSPLRRDLRLEALSEVVRGELVVHSHCYRSDEILRLLTVAEDYGFRIGTLQHVLEGYRIAPEIARHGAGASTFSDMWAYKIEAYGAIPHNAALMTRHGICVSINSDSPNTIRMFGLEAAKSIRWGGLDPSEALKLVTINPARQLGIDQRVGSLEVGKDGDIAIFNGHPLNSLSKCVMTLIEGEVYFEDDNPEPRGFSPRDAARISPPPAQIDRTIPTTLHRAYAIVGATVHPISGPVIEHATVVVVNDLIEAVGADAVPPPDAGIIQGAGLHVYPGLIDGGSTLGLREIGSIRATNDNSELGAMKPEIRAASAVHAHSEHIRIARTAGTTTAVTKPGGGLIAGQSAVIHLDGWTADEMLFDKAFALHMSVPSLPARLPADQKKERTKTHKEQMRKLEDYIKKARHYAAAKDLIAAGADFDFEVDLALEAMIPYVRKEKPVVFSASSHEAILDAIAFAEKQDLRCVISGGTQAWKVADLLAKRRIPVILGTVLSYPRGEFEPWDSIYRCAERLDAAGVAFCFASESASGAYDLSHQAGMAVAHGLPLARAERALTLGAAEILGIADRVGSIEPGKRADLIVTTGSPLQTTSVVTHMFIDGKPIELTSMHTESYEKFMNRPNPVFPPLPELRGPANLTSP